MPGKVLVCSGGGAAGSFTVGVSKVVGLDYDYMIGASVGGLFVTAASHLKDQPDAIEEIFRDSFTFCGVFNLNSPLSWVRKSGIVGLKKIRDMVESIAESHLPQIDYGVTYVDLKSGKTQICEIEKGKKLTKSQIDCIIASASIPILVEPTAHGIDAGTRNNIPLGNLKGFINYDSLDIVLTFLFRS